MCIFTTRKTYKYQGRVQVIVISLVEFPVALLGHLAVIFIESRSKILRSRVHVLPLTMGEVSAMFRGNKKRGPTHPLVS